jgi:hypothetical protein
VLELTEFSLDLMSFVMLVAETVMNSPIHLEEKEEKDDSYYESAAENRVELIKAVYELDGRSDQA